MTNEQAERVGIELSDWHEFLDFLGCLRDHCGATYAHVLRVGYYSARLASHEGLDASLALFGGCGHDVGKCAISTDILHAEHFGPEEMALVHCHPAVGQAMLAPVHLEASYIAGIHHQFQPDPYGVTLDEVGGATLSVADRTRVLDVGRLVSVCDAFDASTTRVDHSLHPMGPAGVARARAVLAGRSATTDRTTWLEANCLVRRIQSASA